MSDDAWLEGLRLYDEPHGPEYFIIDHSTARPTWYRLDGTALDSSRPRVPEAEVVHAAIRKGWTPESLYARPPVELVAVFAAAQQGSGGDA